MTSRYFKTAIITAVYLVIIKFAISASNFLLSRLFVQIFPTTYLPIIIFVQKYTTLILLYALFIFISFKVGTKIHKYAFLYGIAIAVIYSLILITIGTVWLTLFNTFIPTPLIFHGFTDTLLKYSLLIGMSAYIGSRTTNQSNKPKTKKHSR
jgi:hypothetical protein